MAEEAKRCRLIYESARSALSHFGRADSATRAAVYARRLMDTESCDHVVDFRDARRQLSRASLVATPTTAFGTSKLAFVDRALNYDDVAFHEHEHSLLLMSAVHTAFRIENPNLPEDE